MKGIRKSYKRDLTEILSDGEIGMLMGLDEETKREVNKFFFRFYLGGYVRAEADIGSGQDAGGHTAERRDSPTVR